MSIPIALNSFVHGDCMEYLPKFPDKYFELAIVDPPYGDGNSGGVEELTRYSDSGRKTKTTRFGGMFTSCQTNRQIGTRKQPFRREIRPIQEALFR